MNVDAIVAKVQALVADIGTYVKTYGLHWVSGGISSLILKHFL